MTAATSATWFSSISLTCLVAVKKAANALYSDQLARHRIAQPELLRRWLGQECLAYCMDACDQDGHGLMLLLIRVTSASVRYRNDCGA